MEQSGFLDTRGGILRVGGVSTAELAAVYGTPLFVFSEARIRHNIDAIRAAFSRPTRAQRTQVFYASKANSNLAILQIVRGSGINVEVNSGGELYKALRAGFAAEQIVYNGVAKSAREIDEAVGAGIFCINVDSAFELGRVLDAARRLERRARIALRLVPEVDAALHGGLATGTHRSKFGIAAEELEAVYREALRRHPDELALVGLHMHVGAQLTDTHKYAEGVRALAGAALRLADATGHRVNHLNLGGGLPVAYLKPEVAALAANSDALLRTEVTPQIMADAAFEALDQTPGADAFRSLLIEPGSSVIADTAILLATVENAKARAGDRWLLLDAGFNTLMDILGYNWYFHAVAAGKADQPADTAYKLGGPLCDSGDVYHDSEGYGRLPDERMLPGDLKPGDLIAFMDTGGYTLEQMNQYNGQPRAAAVLVRSDGEVRLIRRRDSYTDLVAQDVELGD